MQTQQDPATDFQPCAIANIEETAPRVAGRHYTKTMSRLLLATLLVVLGVASGFVANSAGELLTGAAFSFSFS